MCKKIFLFGKNMLFDEKSEIDDITAAIEKKHKNTDKIKS